MRPLFENVDLWKPRRVARYGKSSLVAEPCQRRHKYPSSCHSPPEAEYSQMSYPRRYPAKAAWQAGGRRSRKRKPVERGCL